MIGTLSQIDLRVFTDAPPHNLLVSDSIYSILLRDTVRGSQVAPCSHSTMLGTIHIVVALVQPFPAAVPPLVANVRTIVSSGVPRNDAALTAAVKQLVAEAPTPHKVDFLSTSGRWQVVNAPHIDTLSAFALTSFSPIEYILTPEGGISSFVRYRSNIFGTGWLCTDGSIENVAGTIPKVKIVWDRIWWSPTDSDDPPTFEEGALSALVQAIGQLGFIEDLSIFPVRFVGEDLAVFNFQSFTVTAQRQG